jgi:hypothetical protein
MGGSLSAFSYRLEWHRFSLTLVSLVFSTQFELHLSGGHQDEVRIDLGGVFVLFPVFKPSILLSFSLDIKNIT